MKSQVSIVKCKNYDSSLVFEATKRALDLLGGISNFIKPYTKVLVKPNLLIAKEPEYGITTHPEVVRAVVKLLKDINCKIFIGDSPSVLGYQIQNVDRVYEISGIKKICEQESVELVTFDKRRMYEKFPLTTWLETCDYFINLPKFKTHSLTLLTGAIKNLFGLVSGLFKIELHKNYFKIEDFSKILVDVYQQSKPTLTLVDGIVAMEGDGPGTSGRLRQTNLLLASKDCVALDSIMALIMGIKPFDVPTTKEAHRRGLGNAEINSISILGERLEEVIDKPFLLPATSMIHKLPSAIINIVKKFIRHYPYLERANCTMCGACIKACPSKIISRNEKGIIFDYSGCIACFCCLEVCPASAIKVKKSLLARFIGL